MWVTWFCLKCGLSYFLQKDSRKIYSACCGDWLVSQRPTLREADKSHTALCSVYRDAQLWLAQ